MRTASRRHLSFDVTHRNIVLVRTAFNYRKTHACFISLESQSSGVHDVLIVLGRPISNAKCFKTQFQVPRYMR